MNQIRWWPIGHHLHAAVGATRPEMITTYSENLDRAERDADRTQSLYDVALEAGEDPITLDSLLDTATQARHHAPATERTADVTRHVLNASKPSITADMNLSGSR